MIPNEEPMYKGSFILPSFIPAFEAPEFHNPEPGRTLKSLRSVRLLRTFRPEWLSGFGFRGFRVAIVWECCFPADWQSLGSKKKGGLGLRVT